MLWTKAACSSVFVPAQCTWCQ